MASALRCPECDRELNDSAFDVSGTRKVDVDIDIKGDPEDVLNVLVDSKGEYLTITCPNCIWWVDLYVGSPSFEDDIDIDGLESLQGLIKKIREAEANLLDRVLDKEEIQNAGKIIQTRRPSALSSLWHIWSGWRR